MRHRTPIILPTSRSPMMAPVCLLLLELLVVPALAVSIGMGAGEGEGDTAGEREATGEGEGETAVVALEDAAAIKAPCRQGKWSGEEAVEGQVVFVCSHRRLTQLLNKPPATPPQPPSFTKRARATAHVGCVARPLGGIHAGGAQRAQHQVECAQLLSFPQVLGHLQ